ncbi:ATP-dependent DNA helicase DinG [Larsenimonas suaedae]|uniref:ATP-dependent DNA helicase DinG n=1 Tax=Larsenimonas suaedae TaxID=1851019 RepID=A0ABU1GUZ2_9GAMM|nr:ATP-dependent DNA helicase DinG [Larsenimonas suaedae]MCM2971144.1 ATP-dependent DNA helicase DinG [Larsenimonas suaedae]MDR5895853.1 ATP-dependent DNA helicase DinG [Larsenimonas suaedae]
MLDEALKSEIQSAYRQVVESLSLTPRYGQRLMMAEIARTLGDIEQDDEGRRVGNEHVCVLEAGTGTGKTLAYLLAALPIAKARGKRLVISTATVALQEQVLHQDLPRLKKHSNLTFDYTLAKGRGRYICLTRLEQILDGKEPQANLALFEQFASEPGVTALAEELAEALGSGEWSGDRDSWPESIDAVHWQQLTMDHRQCTNRRCPHFSACPFFKARRRQDEADVIVTNHDLLLADLSLGGGMVLPAPKECIYVLDEGHHLPDKALDHFHSRVPVNATLRWLAQFKKSQTELLAALGHQAAFARLIEGVSEALSQAESGVSDAVQVTRQFAAFEGDNDSGRDRHHRFEKGLLPQPLREQAERLVVPFATLCRALESMTDILRDSLDPDKATGIERDEAERWLPMLSMLHGRALESHGLWQAYAAQDDPTKPPQARWLTQAFQEQGDGELLFSASPVSAAETLARHLWGACFGAIVTSATLTALGRFDRLQEQAGLANRFRYQCMPSALDYSKGRLCVPKLAVDPSNREAHDKAIVTFLSKRPDDEALLVLFSSRAQLKSVSDALPEAVGARVLSQTRLPKRELIERHRAAVDGGKGSMIFGLASFAEGIDLPGNYLTHVVITRLPFSVPDDPVGATLAEWIESQGGNPFMRISVPDASIKLIQATGRLIRKEGDSGTITLLDRRVLTRRYGKALLDALPPFERVIEQE